MKILKYLKTVFRENKKLPSGSDLIFKPLYWYMAWEKPKVALSINFSHPGKNFLWLVRVWKLISKQVNVISWRAVDHFFHICQENSIFLKKVAQWLRPHFWASLLERSQNSPWAFIFPTGGKNFLMTRTSLKIDF